MRKTIPFLMVLTFCVSLFGAAAKADETGTAVARRTEESRVERTPWTSSVSQPPAPT